MDELVNYSLLLGDTKQAAKVLEQSGDLKGAQAINLASEFGVSLADPKHDVLNRHETKKPANDNLKLMQQLGPNDVELSKFTDKQA